MTPFTSYLIILKMKLLAMVLCSERLARGSCSDVAYQQHSYQPTALFASKHRTFGSKVIGAYCPDPSGTFHSVRVDHQAATVPDFSYCILKADWRI